MRVASVQKGVWDFASTEIFSLNAYMLNDEYLMVASLASCGENFSTSITNSGENKVFSQPLIK